MMKRGEEIYYKPSFIKMSLKKIMDVLSYILPERLYASVYRVCFSFYRQILRVLYSRKILKAWLAGDRADLQKSRSVHRIMPYSLVGNAGLEATCDIVRGAEEESIQGALVECGVAEGGSAALMAMVARDFGNRRKIYLFDSFEGLPDPTEKDFDGDSTGLHLRNLSQGSCLGTLEQVEDLLFHKLSLDRNKIFLVKGWFEDTLAPKVSEIGKIAVLRIDADWYESVKCCLECLYDSVAPGGFVILDDYGFCYGAKKAVDEFLEENHVHVDLVPDGTGRCYFSKPTVRAEK